MQQEYRRLKLEPFLQPIQTELQTLKQENAQQEETLAKHQKVFQLLETTRLFSK